MMPAQGPLTASLAVLVLLGTVRAGPFSPRSNGTLSSPRPPPQPGGPSSQLYEHTVEGGEKQVVFTHRINLPPSAGCGCPPGTEPPAPASEVQALKVRLEVLEELVKGLKDHCTGGGCCPVAAQAGTGQTDVRSLCSLHGVFDLSRCACSCEPGWGGPTCSDPADAGTPTFSPSTAPGSSCPDECNDQGRCVRGRCVCFPGYTGPSCGWPSCPGDCRGRGRCVQGACVCRAGFSGADCSQRACPRGCSQRGRCEDGRCVCNPGYTGEDCGVRSCPRGCSQRGRCENGRCVCNPGYTGEDCSQRACPRGCSQRGRCEDGRCVCNPGYTGEDCSQRACPRGCSQRGRCEDGRCVCDPGYTGEDCGVRSCPRDCGEGGRCVDGRCVCWPGYAGEDCGVRTCPRDCRGRGRCEDGECICDAGYSGDDCGVRSCPGDCHQRGRCEDGRCVCWPGYTGPDCGARACPRDCRGRGRCEDGVCVCQAGFTGEDCGVRSCPGDCRGRGRCESGRCVCWPGYTGRDCGTRACPGDCRGRGRCVDGRCVCNPGFTGEDCGSHRCPGDCRGHGRCEDGVCVCDEGYSGEDCGVRRCPRDCNQRGVCQDGVCTCWAGYEGLDCGVLTCPADCHRRGRCEDGRCVCDPGYTGPACATRTCPADCRGRGRCVQGTCMCHAGYSGEDCGQEEPPASACPGGCGPRELCRGGQCVCVEGFHGPDCAIQTCPRDCLGKGECLQGRCVCQEGYAGEDCGEEVPAIESMRMQLLEETTVRTEWTRAPGPVDAYEIQFIPVTEGVSPPFTARVSSSASAYDQRGLAPGQDYQVTVRALRGTSWGPPISKTITTMIDGPQDLRVVAVTPTTLDLSWLRPQAEVDRFVVSYVSAGNQRVRLEVPPEADRTQLTDLMPGVEYVVTVTAERGRAVSYPASVRANTDRAEEQPGKPSAPPRLGELTVRDLTSDSLLLHWTVPEGEFDSFVIQYKDKDGPQVIPVEGPQRSAPIASLEPGRKYKFVLYGLVGKKRHGPLVAEAKTAPQSAPSPETPPRLGELWVTDPTPDSLHLSWTVPEGQFDSFMVQYRDRDGRPHVVPVEGPERSVTVSTLDPSHKYRFTLFGIANKKRYGPLTADGTTAPEKEEETPHPETQEQPLLGELTVTGVTPDSLHLSWTVAQGPFDSFVVQYKDAQGQPQAVPVVGDENEVTVPGLESNRKYKMNLYGLRGRQRVGPVSVVAKTAPQGSVDETLSPTEPGTKATEPPEKPRLGAVTVTEATTDSLSLSWTVPEGQFDHFLVQYRNGDGQPKVVRVPGHEDQVTIPGLEPDHKYKMNLYGFHSGQRVGPVSAIGVTAAEEETPTEPSTEAPQPSEEPLLGELTVTGSSPDSLSLSWTVPQGHFDSFTIQYKDRDGQPQVARVDGQEREATVGELEPGRKYKMHLYGLREGQRVGPVSAVGVTGEVTSPATEPPLEPRLGELTVEGMTPNSVSLSWTVPEGQFDSFVVQYKDRDGQPQVVPVDADQREVTVPDLEPARKYKMNFYGLYGRQRVGPLSVVAMTDPLPPAPATESSKFSPEPRLGNLTVTDVTPDSVGLSWTIPEGEFDSFMVQYKDRDGQPQVVPVAGDQREVIVPGLEPSKKYKFLLFGTWDGKRRGPVSVEVKTAARGDASPGAPPRLGELWVTEPTTDSLRLSWTVPEGHFDSFMVQFKDKGGPQVVPIEGRERTATIRPLDAGRKYKFLLYGLLGKKRFGPLTADGTTEPPSTAEHTRGKQPAKPRLGDELQVTDVTQDSVGLMWTVPEGQFDSFVIQYKDKDGQPQVVPVEGSLREARVSGLDPARRYKLLLYGLHSGKRVGPLSAVAVTAPREIAEAGTESPTHAAVEPRLRELTLEEATPQSLHLSWITEGEFDSFEVQYADRDGQLQVVSARGDQSDITLTGLEADRRYLVTLYGFHDGHRVGPVEIEALTAPQEEEEPSEPPTMAPKPRLGALTVTDATRDSLSFSWTVPEGQFDHFLVQYRNGDGQPKAVRVPGHEDQVTIPGLEPDHKYKMNLYGFHSGQRVGPVSAFGVTAAEEETPTEPSTEAPQPSEEPLLGELTVTGSSPDSLSLSWTVPQGHFDSFTIQYKDRDGQPQVARVDGQEREATVGELEPGRKYKMHLYGLREGQRVGPVSTVGMTAPAEKPTDSPTEKPRLGALTVTDATRDSLSFSWTVPEGQFDHFLVQYRNGDGQPKAVRVPGHEDQVTIPGLEPDHKYKMNLYGFHSGQRVGPVSAIGVTAAEEETPTEPSTEAPQPSEEPLLGELTVTGSSPDSLSLSWTVPQGHFDSFTIQYKDRDGRPQVARVDGQEREATVGELEPGRKYKMHLYGLREGQRVGPVSTVGVTATQHEATTTHVPSEKPRLGALTVTDATSNSLSLSWTVPEGQFDHFLVQYRNGDGQPKAVRVPGHEDQVTIPGLEPDHKYKMNLYGFHSGQRVGPVSAIGVTAAEEETPTEPSMEAPQPSEEPLLGELTVTGSSPDSLSLSWTVPQGHFDSFTIQYKDRDGRPQVVRVDGQEREATVGELEPGRKYKMHLYGFREGQRVGPVSTVGVTEEEATTTQVMPITTPEPPPEKPRLGALTVTDATSNSLSLSWTVPEGQFDHFLVQYRNGDGQPKAVRVPGHEDQVTIPGLEPDHKYKMNLYGFHSGQRVGPVSAIGVTAAEEETPTEPSTEAPQPSEEPLLGVLTVTGSSPDSLSLSWTVPQGHFDSFTIQYKDRDGRPQVVRVDGQEREATVGELEPGRKYKMHLYGLREGQRVGPVSTVGVTEEEATTTQVMPTTTPEPPPEKPRLGALTVTDATSNSLSLSWTVPEGQFDHFLVQYRNGDGQPKAVRVPGHEDQVTIPGLEPDHKYKMNLYGFHSGQRVGPVSAIGVTAAEEETPTEPSTEAPQPSEEPLLGVLTVTGSSPDSLSLSWTVPQGHFDSFTIQYKDRDGRPQVVRVDGQEREATVGELEPGRKYKMHLYGLREGQRVGPVSTVGMTAPEEEATTTPVMPTTTLEPPPQKPRLGALTVTDATADSLSLSWTVPEGQFDHFLVQYKNGDGQPKAVRVPGHEDQVTIPGLEPDHKYKMNLYGFHSGQRVGPVSAFGVTAAEEETPTEPSTEAPQPSEEPLLGELTVTGSSPDSLSLSWTVPQGHFDSFTIQYKDRDGRPQVVRVDGLEREATVGELEPGRKYKMHLYGLREGQRVGPVSTVGVTASQPTQPPMEQRLGELSVAEVTSDTVGLSWTVAQGPFDSFLVQYKDAQGQPQAVPVSGDGREVTLWGLDPARKYKFLLFGLHAGKRHGPVSVDARTLPDTKPPPRLGELTVKDVTPDSVGLSWTVPEGEFDSFLVQYKDRDGQPQVVPVTADQHGVIVPGLEPNKKYKFLLYGLAGRKRLGPVSAEGTTAPLERTPPPRLGELTVTGETPDSVQLSWTVAQGPFDSFLIQYRDRGGQPHAVPVAADQQKVTVEGLEPGRKYKFLLYGLLGGKRLGPVSTVGVTAPEEDTPAPEDPEAPEAPRLGMLAVTEATPDSLRLSWSVARGPFDSFVVQYQDTEGQPQALLMDGDQDKVLISGLEPSTSYNFSLYGLHAGKRHGPISAEGTTGPAPAGLAPGDPGPRLSQLSVTDVTTSSLRLNWEAPLGAFDSFLLRFGVPSPSILEPHPRPLLQRELMVPGTRRSAVLRDLRPGTLYSLTLYGLRGPHKADSTQGTAHTLSPVLESPRDLQFSDIGETSAKVNWVPPPSRVDSFKVSYQLADGGEPQSVLVDGRTQSQILQGLSPDTRYEVTVVSVRGFEESEPLTGFLTTVPDGPTQLRALNLTEGSALLHWKPPQNPVDKYNVRVAAPGAPPLQASAPGSAVDYPLRDLVLHTNYTATVRGLRGPNLTSPASITFTTGLKAPQDLEAKEVTPRTALLTWTEPQVPPTGYLLSFDTPGGQTQEILLPAGSTSQRLRGLFPSTFYNARLQAVWGESLTPPVSTSFTTGGLRIPFPRDCGEEMQNGVSTSKTTTIFLNGNRERPLDVFCDMETDGGGWLVFQRRMDGQTDFWRDWEEYAHGFGNISREFWLGNEVLHSLTQAGDYSMRVDLRAGDEAVFAQYDSFRVDSAAEYYRLHLAGYHGTAGDSMSYHSGSVFSARDRDPNNLLISCAVSYRGAWWYRNCHYANLNGLYGSTVDHQGVSWYHWKGFEFSVPFTEMKLRPRRYEAPSGGG
uniref:tenascin-X isoform X1 n=1 Tax=Jaculus jaculus TaxID=51337 RepID=UPI001E1B188C|nr:tenascin-X isoform X1 [Jaculus jaculus]